MNSHHFDNSEIVERFGYHHETHNYACRLSAFVSSHITLTFKHCTEITETRRARRPHAISNLSQVVRTRPWAPLAELTFHDTQYASTRIVPLRRCGLSVLGWLPSHWHTRFKSHDNDNTHRRCVQHEHVYVTAKLLSISGPQIMLCNMRINSKQKYVMYGIFLSHTVWKDGGC